MQNNKIEQLQKQFNALTLEVADLKKEHLETKKSYSSSLRVLRDTTVHASETAQKAARAAEHSVLCSEKCLKAAKTAAQTNVVEAAKAASEAATHAAHSALESAATAATAAATAAMAVANHEEDISSTASAAAA